MKLHRFSVAMALVFPLMDFSGPKFYVSLTYFPCLYAVSIPSVQPRSDVCDFSSKCLPHSPREKIHPSAMSPDSEGKTDHQQHFVNQEHNRFHLLDGGSSHPCTQGPWSHSQISQRPLTEYSYMPSTAQDAEDIKMQKERDARCSQSSRVSRLGDLPPST